MADVVQGVHTDPSSLSRLVRWAHSHGTICSLIPSLQNHVQTFSGLGPDLGPGPVITWGCRAGHAYHWPPGDHGTGCRGGAGSAVDRPPRFVVGRPSHLSCSDGASEGEEPRSRLADVAGCDSSATDEDGDGERHPFGKRGGALADAAVMTVKRLKQEVTSEGYDNHVNSQQSLGGQGSVKTEAELLLGGGSVRGTTEEAETRSSATGTKETGTAPEPCEQLQLENLRASLSSERSRNQQMMEVIWSLKQDKELLESQVSRKAELICELLQDKVQPERRWPQSSFTDPGGSQVAASSSFDLDPTTRFDSFGEMDLHAPELHPPEPHPAELHPPDLPRTVMGKRVRDGETPRVRMKNVSGVIARYSAALQEFRRSVSMKVAFDRVGVDRNTISRTAAIAELSLAAPEVFGLLAPWDEREETLAHYAQRCRHAMDDAVRLKIKVMKARGELLPIVSK